MASISCQERACSIGYMLVLRVVIEAAPGAGKSMLLVAFIERFPQFDCIKISFDDPTVTAIELFRRHGIDIEREEFTIPLDVICVLLVDYVACKFHEKSFWDTLISLKVPPTLRFVFAGTYTVLADEADLLHKSLWTRQLWREYLTLTDDEALAVLRLPSGLPAWLQSPTLMQMIISDCNGHVGSLCTVYEAVSAHFGASKPSERDLVLFYLSKDVLQLMERWFGSLQNTTMSETVRMVMTQWMMDYGEHITRPPYWGPRQFEDRDLESVYKFFHAGLFTPQDGYVGFASPLAERYLQRVLFPVRASQLLVSSLVELIHEVLRDMSASELEYLSLRSTRRLGRFPEEEAFAYFFMARMMAWTPST